MKICRLQLKLLLSLSVFLVLGLLLFATPVKAEIVETVLTVVDGNLTVPAYNYGAILLCGDINVDGDTTFTYGTATSTDLFRDIRITTLGVGIRASYIKNPLVGTYSWSGNNYRATGFCILFEGLDEDYPINAVTEIADPWTDYTGTSYNAVYPIETEIPYVYLFSTWKNWQASNTLTQASSTILLNKSQNSFNGAIETIFKTPTHSTGYTYQITNPDNFGIALTALLLTPYVAPTGYPDGGSNGYNNIIFPRNQPTLGSLIEDTNTVFYYSYNTALISNTLFGAIAYLEISRCGDIGCSEASSTTEYFTDYTGATSTKSYILSSLVTAGTSTTATPGQSFFTLPAPTTRLGTTTTVAERYRVTPHYLNIYDLTMYTANPVVFLVTWQNTADTFENIPQSQPCVSIELDENKLCTDETLSCSVRNGITKAMFWLTSPSCTALNYFQSGYSAIKAGFPFNAYFDVADAINTAIDSATSTASTTIGVPFIERLSSTSSNFIILPVISSTTISNAIGETNANTVRTTLTFVIWILSALLVFFIIQKV